MEVTLILKVRLLPDQDQAEKFRELTQVYADACDYLSRYAFEAGTITDTTILHDAKYYEIRRVFSMKAQLTQSVIKTVVARYKALEKQLQSQPYRLWDKTEEKGYSFQRDLNWLQSPISFTRPQADLVRNRDWSFVKLEDGTPCLSVASMEGREKVQFVNRDFCRFLFDPSWKLGTGKLVHSSGAWVQHKRMEFAATRASMQAKGTKGDKRALKRVSGRENRFMADVNHQLSKALCTQYPGGTLFVLENLAGISFEPKYLHGGSRSYMLRSWAFYDLEEKLIYKALLGGARS